MSIININVEGAVQTHVLPAGEHRVTIVSAVKGPSKSSGREQVSLIFEPTDDPYAEIIRDYMPTEPFPDIKQDNRRLLRWGSFASAFNASLEFTVDDDTGAVEAWVGLTGYIILSVKEDPQYGEQNRVEAYVASH